MVKSLIANGDYSVDFLFLEKEIPRGKGRADSSESSSRQTDSQSQVIPLNSFKSPDTAYLSIAATTCLSQLPQLCEPRIFPPAVGWTINDKFDPPSR